MDLIEELRELFAHDQAIQDMARGAAVMVLLEALPVAEAETVVA